MQINFGLDGLPMDCDFATLEYFGCDSADRLFEGFFRMSPRYQPCGALSRAVFAEYLSKSQIAGSSRFIWLFQKDFTKYDIMEVYLVSSVNNSGQITGHFNEFFIDPNAILQPQQIVSDWSQSVFDSMPHVYGFLDLNLNLLTCNKAGANLFKFNNHNDLVENYAKLLPAHQPCGLPSIVKLRHYVAMVMLEGRHTFEWFFVAQDGDEIPCELTVMRISYKGEPILSFFVRDLRDYYAVMHQRERVEQRLQAMIDTAPISCFILDCDLNVLECNQETAILLELESRDDFIDGFFDFIPEHQPDGRLSFDKIREKMNLVMETGRAYFEWICKNASGQSIPCEITGVRVRLNDRDVAIVYMRDLREIQSTVAMMERLNKLAFTDFTTEAHNRLAFVEIAEAALKNATEDAPVSLIFLDIDDFKQINDNYGHLIGDEVLRILVSRIRHCLRRDTLVARYGGEEFVILLPGSPENDAENAANRIRENVAKSPFLIKEDRLFVTASFGVATYYPDENFENPLQELIRKADEAMFAIKRSGKNAVAVYSGLGVAYSEMSPKPPSF
ncbi:MAG: GGDEF domain-containing protein [Defluviitaleaceae bacterium]|nr:GGDEF domain-containing protein [Defluviitaleaceae bacterium]